MDNSIINNSISFAGDLNTPEMLSELNKDIENTKIDGYNAHRSSAFNSPIYKRGNTYQNNTSYIQNDVEIQNEILRDGYQDLEKNKKQLEFDRNLLNKRIKDIEETERNYNELEKNYKNAISKFNRNLTELEIRENILKENQENLDKKISEFNKEKDDWLQQQYNFNKDVNEGKLFMESYQSLKSQQMEKLSEIESNKKQLLQREKEVNEKLERSNRLEVQCNAREEIIRNKEKIAENQQEELRRKIDHISQQQRALNRKEFDLKEKMANTSVYKKEKELLSEFEKEKEELFDRLEELKLENDRKSNSISNFERQIEKLQRKITQEKNNRNRLVTVFGTEDKFEDLTNEDSFNVLFNQPNNINVKKVNSDIVQIVKIREKKLKAIEKELNNNRSSLELNYAKKINTLKDSHKQLEKYKTKFREAYLKLVKLRKDVEKRMKQLESEETVSQTTKGHMEDIYRNIYQIKTELTRESSVMLSQLNNSKKETNTTLEYLNNRIAMFRSIKNNPNTKNISGNAKDLDLCMKHAVMNIFIKMKFNDPFVENLNYVLLKMGEVKDEIYKKEFIPFLFELKKMLWLDYKQVKRTVKIKSEELYTHFDMDSFLDVNKLTISNLIHENNTFIRGVSNYVLEHKSEQKLNYQKIFAYIRQLTTNILKQERIIPKNK